jgi:hypothetical protein
MEEAKNAIEKLKNSKSPGLDNLQAELLKYGGKEMVNILHDIILQMWITEEIPKDWSKSIVCPIHKKET